MMMTKTRFLVGFLLLFTGISLYPQLTKALSEEAFEGFDYGGELSQMVNIPNSPEAAAFMQYGNTKVNLYVGAPNVSVPLHVIQGRELNLPLTLTYDASPIGVKQLASWVGLSWNLAVGGRISRVLNGLADDYSTGSHKTVFDHEISTQMNTYRESSTKFGSAAEVQGYFDFLYGINQGSIDALPDYYSLNVLGINEMIVFDNFSRAQAKALDNPRIKISAYQENAGNTPITKWHITGDDGTQYFFEVAETTWHDGNDKIPSLGSHFHKYNSSWVLTKVISANEKDIYEFSYTDFGEWDQEQAGHSASHAVNTLSSSTYYASPDSQTSFAPNYRIKQQFLSSIKHNGTTVLENSLGARSDIDINSALTQMKLYNTNGSILKTVDFEYSYFNEDVMDNDSYSPFDIRLKLDQVHIKGSDAVTYQTYGFEYIDPNQLPSRSSKAQDYLGNYNGVSNSVLYPKVTIAGMTFAGANREPSFSNAQKGLLEKITYPTGGYTTFDYEANTLYTTEQTTNRNYLANTTLNSSWASTIDFNLYRDDDGNYCDDRYEDYASPIIYIGEFYVAEEDTYKVTYTAQGGNAEFYMAHGTNKSDVQGYDTYCDFYAAGNVNLFYGNTRYSFSENTTLPKGWYRYVLLLDESDDQAYGISGLKIYETTTSTISYNTEAAGIRIAKITDYTQEGEVALIKSYDYNSDSGKSNAIENYKPDLYYRTFTEGSNGSTQSQLHRMAAIPGGHSQPYMVYSSVKESKEDGIGNTLGYTRYSFHRGEKGAIPSTAAPYLKNYVSSIGSGTPSYKSVIDQNDHLLTQEHYEYQEYGSDFSVWGMSVVQDQAKANTKLMLRKYANDDYGYAYHSIFVCSGGGWCSTSTICVEPEAYGYESCLLDQYKGLSPRYSYAVGKMGGIANQTTTHYYYDDAGNAKAVTTTNETSYETAKYRPRTITTTDSEGDLYQTTNYYSSDGIVAGSASLTNANKITEVVQRKKVKNPDSDEATLLSMTTKNYSAGLVSTIQTAKGHIEDPQLEDRASFSYYSDTKNLKEATQTNGVTTTYIWGYNNTYPIAKIENATYDQVATYVSNLQAKADADTDHCTAASCKEQQLRDALQTLREALPNAMVSSYTYDPQIGVTSMTDPKGYTTYYSYDNFHRLEQVKDDQGKLLSENVYHYKNQD